jgi:hypothetical protein
VGVKALFWTICAGLLCSLSARSEATNEILLHSSKAIVHGETLRYEPATNKITLGYWTNPKDWAEWKFSVDRPGVFEIEVLQGCGRGQGGSDVNVEAAGQTNSFVVEDTGGFQNFVPRKIGRAHFWRAGEFSLALKPQNKKRAAVMDVRQVRLVRVPVSGKTALANEVLNARRIVFLGDSITHGGEYVAFLEGLLRAHYPDA